MQKSEAIVHRIASTQFNMQSKKQINTNLKTIGV